MNGTAPIVPEVIRLGAAAVPTADRLLQSAYGTIKSHALLTAGVALPLTLYGFVTGRRWARWAGGIAGAIALYQLQQANALNQQVTALDLARLRAEPYSQSTSNGGG